LALSSADSAASVIAFSWHSSRQSLDAVDLLLDVRDDRVRRELLLSGLARRLAAGEHLLAGRLDLLSPLRADRVALGEELAL